MSETRAESNLQTDATTEIGEQYGIWQILGIWAGSALPMGLNYWVIMPILLSRGSVNPFMYLFLVTLGLVWQGVLAFIILKREVRPFTWQGLKDRLWLYIPSNPKTRIRSKRLYLWTIPLVILMQAYFRIGVMDWLNNLWMKVFPFLTPSPLHNNTKPGRTGRGTVVVDGCPGGHDRFQLPAGRGIDLPGNPAAENEWRVWKMGLACQPSFIRDIPFA